MFDFSGKVVVVTGGARGIGRCICEEFQREGAKVCPIDRASNPYCVGDLADRSVLERFAAKVIEDHGGVDCLINNAPPPSMGIGEAGYEDFARALAVGVTAPFYLTKLFLPHFRKGASIVNISSSRDRMSQRETESYTAAKGGIAALTHALAVSLAGTGELHLPGLDRNRRHPVPWPGRPAASRGTGGGAHGHRQHGALPVQRQGGFHHRGEHLHRRGHDPANGLPRGSRLGAGNGQPNLNRNCTGCKLHPGAVQAIIYG